MICSGCASQILFGTSHYIYKIICIYMCISVTSPGLPVSPGSTSSPPLSLFCWGYSNCMSECMPGSCMHPCLFSLFPFMSTLLEDDAPHGSIIPERGTTRVDTPGQAFRHIPRREQIVLTFFCDYRFLKGTQKYQGGRMMLERATPYRFTKVLPHISLNCST